MKHTHEQTITHDSGWIEDGHRLHWSDQGVWLTHTASCPFYTDDDDMRRFLCTPGLQDETLGIFLTDLPDDQYERVFLLVSGGEPIQWRIREAFHPDMDNVQVQAVALFELRLAEHDEENF